jgi:hypothetical protein
MMGEYRGSKSSFVSELPAHVGAGWAANRTRLSAYVHTVDLAAVDDAYGARLAQLGDASALAISHIGGRPNTEIVGATREISHASQRGPASRDLAEVADHPAVHTLGLAPAGLGEMRVLDLALHQADDHLLGARASSVVRSTRDQLPAS